MERRLAAILAADVVGYTRLMGADEAGTLAAMRAHRAALIDPLVDLVQHMVVSVGFCDLNGRLRIGVALKEALNNAMYHGNLELGPSVIPAQMFMVSSLPMRRQLQ